MKAGQPSLPRGVPCLTPAGCRRCPLLSELCDHVFCSPWIPGNELRPLSKREGLGVQIISQTGQRGRGPYRLWFWGRWMVGRRRSRNRDGIMFKGNDWDVCWKYVHRGEAFHSIETTYGPLIRYASRVFSYINSYIYMYVCMYVGTYIEVCW